MQKWEYYVITWDQLHAVEPGEVKKFINDLGEDGWELVSVTSFHETQGLAGRIHTGINCKLFFKRPKS